MPVSGKCLQQTFEESSGCHEAVSFFSNIICITQIDFTSLVSVRSYRLQKFQVSSQSSVVYNPYPRPLLPAVSPQGRVQLCTDYALLIEISRNVALVSILCLPTYCMRLLLVLTTQDLDFPVLLTSLKRPDLSFKDCFKTVNLQCTNLHLWYGSHSTLSLLHCSYIISILNFDKKI